MARISGPAFVAPATFPVDSLGLGLDRPLGTFSNPLYAGADPWVVRHGQWYYSINSGAGGRLEVWRSETLIQRGERQVVWTPPCRGWNSRQVWAPELHRLHGKWYIYYAASDGRNVNHRMGVLESVTDDPQGQYIDKGPLYTGDDSDGWKQGDHKSNRWAIDGTVLDLRGQLYFIWSGWQHVHDVQHMYVAPMDNPWTVSSDRVRLCDNDNHPWERCGDCHRQRGLNEAPQVLTRNGKVFLVYSCSGSWQTSYKLGLLHMDERADPLNPSSWKKLNRPVFEPTREVFGVGHCCFTTSPDGTEDWILYHAKRNRWDGWRDRVVRAQSFGWDDAGFPDFGRPTSYGQALSVPSDGTSPRMPLQDRLILPDETPAVAVAS